MKREDIIRMARKAELAYGPDEKPLESVLCFAELVAAYERDECAKIADLVAREMDNTNNTASYIASGIRARGDK